MGSQIKNPPVLIGGAYTFLKAAELSGDKKRIRKAKENYKTAKLLKQFVAETEFVSTFRKDLEDKKKCRIDESRIRDSMFFCVLLYIEGEALPSSHEVLFYVSRSRSIANKIKAENFGREDIDTALDAIKQIGLASKKGKGLWRWIGREEFLALEKNETSSVLEALDQCLVAVGDGVVKFLVWSLGR